MSKKDHYQVLGIQKGASHDDIKKAYRKMAMQHHPDRNPNDKNAETRFKEVSTAYETLSDPQKKQMYDQYGHAGPRMSGGGQGFGFDPSDMFNTFFGGGGGRRQRTRGGDIRVEINISFEDVLNGTERQFTYLRKSVCTGCQGEGGESEVCAMCSGYGKVRQDRGNMQLISTCPQCRGTGAQITVKCKECKSDGQIDQQHTVKLTVPKGIQNGAKLRIQGEADEDDASLPRGDLICQMMIVPHAIFSLQGVDLIHETTISFAQACLGATIEVPTIDGPTATLKIPPGTQFQQSLRMKGKGLPHFKKDKRGNQYVIAKIDVPKSLNEEQSKLLKQFDEIDKE